MFCSHYVRKLFYSAYYIIKKQKQHVENSEWLIFKDQKSIESRE